MPIYEYQCKQCQHQDSEIESINAPRIKKCPACGKRSFSRLISASAFHLKGSGWYVTDFKNKKADKPDKKTDKADKDDKADKGDKGADKTDKGADKAATSGESSSKESKRKTSAKPNKE